MFILFYEFGSFLILVHNEYSLFYCDKFAQAFTTDIKISQLTDFAAKQALHDANIGWFRAFAVILVKFN